MICAHCRYAGQQSVFVAENPEILKLIAVAHSQCLGKNWCYCAHRLPGSAGDLTGGFSSGTLEVPDRPASMLQPVTFNFDGSENSLGLL
jgi:hypothetical protein